MSGRQAWLTAALITVAGIVPAAGPLTASAAIAADSAAHASISASPHAALPGQTVTVSGVAPSCVMRPVMVNQHWHDYKLQVQNSMGTGGVTGADGSFAFSVTVPPKIVRSDVQRPFSPLIYDVVAVSFEGCSRVLGANIFVKPVNRRVHFTLSTLRPRSKGSLHIKATHCIGDPVPDFTQLIDRTGEYFYPTKTSYTGTTFTATFRLRSGFYGPSAHAGAAHPSRPGRFDALVAIPCTRSEGPRSVARADHLWHSSVVVDLHIRRAR
jgi:hypothetical protein